MIRQKQTAPSGELRAAGTTRPAGPCYLYDIIHPTDPIVNPDTPDLCKRLAQTRRALELAEAENNGPAATVLTACYRALEERRRAFLAAQARTIKGGQQ